MKTILITGAARGLGYSLTKVYLNKGHQVIAGVRDIKSPKILALAEEFKNNLMIIALDVDDTNSVVAAAQVVQGKVKQVDCIINNAAIHNPTSFMVLEDTDLDECMSVYSVNSIGPLRVVKGFLNLLKAGNNPTVFNVSSESGSISVAQREKEFGYCMSKAALNMGTKLLGNYLLKDHIQVIAIHPGWIRTDMGGQNAHFSPDEIAEKLVDLFEVECLKEEGPRFIDYEGVRFPW